MPFNIRMVETTPVKVEAFPDHEFHHKYVIVDENDKPTGQEWRSGDRFDWESELRPADPDTDWWAFVKDINSLIDDAKFFRQTEIPRLQKKEESLAKKIEDLSFHMEVRKKEMGQSFNRNVRNRSAYYMLRDYEARFNLLHGLAQLTQVQSQVIDLLTGCVIRRVQARLRWLLPLFCKVWMQGEGEDAKAAFELYVWHPYTDDLGNILEDRLETDAMRDYPLILQQIMDPAKYRALVIEQRNKAQKAAEAKARGEDGKIVIAGDKEVRDMASFQKKFMQKPTDGGLAK